MIIYHRNAVLLAILNTFSIRHNNTVNCKAFWLLFFIYFIWVVKSEYKIKNIIYQRNFFHQFKRQSNSLYQNVLMLFKLKIKGDILLLIFNYIKQLNET